VLLRDDKTYPYIKATLGEKFPRLVKTRVLANDGSKYFGPYADVGALNRILDLLNNAYRLKRCARESFPENWRPCLNGFIGGCDAVCKGAGDIDEYMERFHAATDFLRGKKGTLAAELKSKMTVAAERGDFEEAAKWRDLSRDADAVTQRQKVDLLSSGSMDVLIARPAEEGAAAQATLFFVRNGRLVGREIHILDAEKNAEKKEIASAFIKQYYANQTMFPKEILLEERIDDAEAIEAFLSQQAERRVALLVPERGKKHDLLALAQKDVAESAALANRLKETKEDAEKEVLSALLELAGVEKTKGEKGASAAVQAPRIEAYDVSHTGGADAVGAMVVFRGTKKSPKDYRRFKIKTALAEFADKKGGDDYAATQEILYRRFKRALAGDKGFCEFPDVVLLDGGKGQISAANEALTALGLYDIPLLAMVKDDKHRTRGLIAFKNGEYVEHELASQPKLFHLIGTIQEEVHRFAITYHRQARQKTLLGSKKH